MAEKVLKSQVERDREEAAAAMDRYYAMRGDTRTQEEQNRDRMLCSSISREEGERIIASILDEDNEYLGVDGADGAPHLESKAERIASIRAIMRE